ncbi:MULTISPECIES: hypothetical protein [Anaerostipes]|uniref:Uncharacterized protein n=1 Tax=Anaerostipes butyraticus TaxID=645466 RepID=A0A916QAE3_9FIRM|nr:MULTISPECIES: hypothetical protein [Anaerostipes]GFO84824.1 hypothetical protein ANBU17_11710 [Anaerostipes butyraticus]
MNQNPNFELERQKLNQTYEKMNAGKTSSHDDSRIPTYWTFLKLRIGFSILLLFFLAVSVKAFPSPETKHIQKVLRQIDQMDPYTQEAMRQIQSVFPK